MVFFWMRYCYQLQVYLALPYLRVPEKRHASCLVQLLSLYFSPAVFKLYGDTNALENLPNFASRLPPELSKNTKT
jgi:hypothetical protein